jgi:RHS repeat-associated protein
VCVATGRPVMRVGLRVPVAVVVVRGPEVCVLGVRRFCTVVCVLFAALACVSSADAAVTSRRSLESPEVREALAHRMQLPGPVTVTQGGSGGTSAASPPAGELVPSLSTAFSDTWRAHGSPLVTRIFNEPVNYKGPDSAWHAIDSSLVASPLGGYENTANSFMLRLPESLTSAVSLTDQGRTLSFALEGATASLPSVSGAAATYPGVLPSTDLAYVSEATGMREIATLKDAGAPSVLRYSLSLPSGLEPHTRADGSIAVEDSQGNAPFAIPAPVAYRPSQSAASGRTLPVSVAAAGSGWTITVNTGEAWLRDELATGPVAIDPTVTLSASQACTLVAETPKVSSCASTELQEGYDATHQEHHGLLQFNVSTLPVGAVILNAKLGLYVQAHSTSTAKAVGVYRVTKGWTSAATWETYDGTHAWATAGGDYANPEKNSDASLNSAVGAATGWYYWYPTKMVQEWANTTNAPENQGYANEGLILKDQTDNTTANLLTIPSPSAASNKPFLEVSYQAGGEGSEPQYTTLPMRLSDSSTLGVNVASGNLQLQSSQLQIPGVAGHGFASARTWNGLNGEKLQYGHWKDSNSVAAHVQGDGSIVFKDGMGTWFQFQKQADGSFITPLGIKATMCSSTHPEPCAKTFPTGISYELVYNQSQEHVDFNTFGEDAKREDRYKNTISEEFPSEHHFVFTDTQARKIEQIEEGPEHYLSEIKDITGSRTLKFSYETFSEGEPELASATDANGKTTSYGYSNYTIVKITDPTGQVTKLVYDSKRRITEIIRTTNTEHTTGPTTKFKYYEIGEAPKPCTAKQKETVVTDPDGAEGQAGHITTYCSNVLDEVEQTFDAEEHEGKVTFDAFGNETSSTAPLGGVTSMVYDTTGHNLECELQGTTGKPATECPAGRLEKGYSGKYKYTDTTFVFQPTSVISPREQATSLCYWEGSASCSVPEGEKGTVGALKQEKDALATQNTTNYSYNSNGTVSTATDPLGHKTSYEYDSSGNLKTVIPPAGSGLGKRSITVDAVGRPHVVTHCLVESGGSCTSSETATLTYDNLDRVTEAVDTGPGATKTFKYTYDANGDLEKRVDPTGTTNLKYDPINRLTEEALPGPVSNVYTYDAASNLGSLTDAGGTTQYLYNKLNELNAMYEPGGNCGETPAKCTTFAYDNDGALTKVTYPSKATLNYTRDPTTGRPTAISAKSPAGETLLSHSYSYLDGTNDTPLIFSDTFAGPSGVSTQTFEKYDELDRLIQALTTSKPATYAPSCYVYAYDGAGNRTLETSSPQSEVCLANEVSLRYNSGSELECRMKKEIACSKSSSSEISGYTYDGAGNQTAITGYSDPASTAFSYNNLNQLKSLTPPGLSERTVNYLGSGQTTLTTLGATTLQNSAVGLTKQANEAGTSYYARTPAGLMVDERLPGGTSYNPIYDSQGDVIGLLNTAGELVQSVRYGPYGENSTAEGSLTYSATDDPFLFQGGYHVAGGNTGGGNIPNGLYHYGERYYDPTVGRWTQQDPTGGMAAYGFTEDDPVNESDQAGTCPFDRDLRPSIISRGRYTYVEVCGTRGRRAGKRQGYVRFNTASYERARARGNVSTGERVVGGVVGAGVVVAGVGAGTLCAVGTWEFGPEGPLECAKAASGPIVAGGLTVWGAITGE